MRIESVLEEEHRLAHFVLLLRLVMLRCLFLALPVVARLSRQLARAIVSLLMRIELRVSVRRRHQFNLRLLHRVGARHQVLHFG